MKTFWMILLVALVVSPVSAQDTGFLPPPPIGGGGSPPPAGDPPPPLPPIVFTPLILEGQVNAEIDPIPNGVEITNRGHLVSPPVDLELLQVNVTVYFPTAEMVDVVYRDFIDIAVNADPLLLNPNRPWGFVQTGVVIVRVFQGNLCVYVIDAEGERQIFSAPINTADGQLPVHLEIREDEGALIITCTIPPGIPQTYVVLLPPGLNGEGNVIIHNRESVAGVDFVAEVLNLSVGGTPIVP